MMCLIMVMVCELRFEKFLVLFPMQRATSGAAAAGLALLIKLSKQDFTTSRKLMCPERAWRSSLTGVGSSPRAAGNHQCCFSF